MGHYIAKGGPWPEQVGHRRGSGRPSDRGVGRHRARAPTPMRRRIIWMAVVGLIAAGVIGYVGWLLPTRLHHQSTTDTASTTSRKSANDAANAWIATNLPKNTRLLVDGTTPPAGYPARSLDEGVNWRDFDYLVTTTTTNPPPDSIVAPVWRQSVPAALFDSLEVRRILAGTPPEEIARIRDMDRINRLRAATALMSNPSLVVSPGAQPILARGDLDMRPASVLAGLAAQQHLTLNDIEVVPPEAAAGVPARAITIYATDPAEATRAVSAFAAPFQPDQVTVGVYGAIRLHWPLNFALVPLISH
jgi:hypothetical protein